MRCPYCVSELAVTNYSRYQNLDEHVIRPNDEPRSKPEYHCVNNQCSIHGRDDIFWDETGDVYCDFRQKGDTNLESALDSLSRRLSIEIYKHDEDHDLFSLGRFVCRVEYIYKANEQGEILKRTRAYTILRKEKSSRLGMTSKKKWFVQALWNAFVIHPYRFGSFLSKNTGEKWYSRMWKNYKKMFATES